SAAATPGSARPSRPPAPRTARPAGRTGGGRRPTPPRKGPRPRTSPAPRRSHPGRWHARPASRPESWARYADPSFPPRRSLVRRRLPPRDKEPQVVQLEGERQDVRVDADLVDRRGDVNGQARVRPGGADQV